MRASPSKVIAAALAAATLLVTFMVISGGEPPAPDGAGRVADRRDPSARDAEEAALITSEVSAVDGTDAAAARIERVLWNDPATGVMRHADAGYEDAIACAHEHGLNLPSLDAG